MQIKKMESYRHNNNFISFNYFTELISNRLSYRIFTILIHLSICFTYQNLSENLKLSLTTDSKNSACLASFLTHRGVNASKKIHTEKMFIG